MKSCLLLSVLVLGLGAGRTAHAQGDAPRQLGGAPALPPPARPRPAPAPRQLGTAPAPQPDSTRSPAAAVPSAAPAPVYAPTPPGQLPGSNTRPARFQVGLKSGLVYNASDVEVKSPLFGRSYLLLDGRRKLDFAEVGFYEDESGHYVRTTLPGSARESTLRRDKTGRLSLYSITSAQYNSGPGGFGAPGYGGMGGFGMGGMGGFGMGGMGGMGGYRTVKTEFFSKDNGPVQSLTTRNLLLATNDNAGAQQLLAEAQRYQRITLASYAVGGGLLAYGLLQSFRPSDGSRGISRLLYVAVPVLIVPLVLQGKQASNQRQAIALYNAGR